MKKNFNANIGGIIFHIDEDAYESLSAYLSQLKHHFANTDGAGEILGDIEIRIAEMLQQRITDEKQVVTQQDVNEVVAAMGQPSDFDPETSGRSEEREKGRPKRFFRDPDNKMVGGVASGLSAYFHTDPLWIRLAFVVITLLGFGTGIIAYLLIWLLVPEAKTTAEKLEMRGEKVTIQNIERSIREEFSDVKEKFSDIREEASAALRRNKTKGANIFEKILNLCIQIFGFLFRLIVVFFGLLFIVIGIFLVIGILISLIDKGNVLYVSSLGISTFSLPVFLRLFLDAQNLSVAIAGLCLVIGIPLIMLIYTGARLIFRFRSPSRFVGIPAFSLFVAGLIICAFIGLALLKDFNHKAVETRNYQIIQPTTGTLTIDVGHDARLDELGYQENRFVIGNWNMISSGDTNIYFGLPQLEVIRTESDSFQLAVYLTARGEDHITAMNRANRISYNYHSSDSLLLLDPFFYLKEDDKFRGQGVKIVVRVPVNRRVILTDHTHLFFERDLSDEQIDLSGKTWKMLDSGLREYRLARKSPAADSSMAVPSDSLRI